jgi:hypothetical protein
MTIGFGLDLDKIDLGYNLLYINRYAKINRIFEHLHRIKREILKKRHKAKKIKNRGEYLWL